MLAASPFSALGEQRALDQVQPRVGGGLQVAGEVVFQQEIIHEGLVLFVSQRRFDDLGEKRGILAGEEEVQLVAGELRVFGEFFVVLELRPLQDPGELGEGGVAAQRGEQRVDAAQRVVGLHFAG